MHSIKSFCRIDETEYALSTNSVNLLYYTLPKSYCDEYKSYDAPRLCTIIDGTKQVQVNNSESFEYKKDKFILLPPHSNVSMFMPESTRALVYEFDDHVIDFVGQRVSDNLQLDVSNELSYPSHKLDYFSDRSSELHSRIQKILVEQDANMDFLIDLSCQEMVYELMKSKGCHDIIHHHKSHPVSRAIRLMNSADGESMTISEIAEEVNMSLANFSQTFKRVTDCRPKEYITRSRLIKSKQHLRNMSVTDTAFEVGYDNISHFIRLFKKEFGVTPKQYQLEGLSRNPTMHS